jgi:hypothetical protein
MPRDNTGSRYMRSQIAHLAARLMAVDGIDDYALAKRKAARQAGAPETRNLPTNEEVEEALRAYQQLYQADEARERLAHLRGRALEMMRLLASFNPFLSGAVLNGSAGKYSEIEIHLFTDNVKEVELFFINRAMTYKTRERRVHIGDDVRAVPVFSLSTREADFEVTVFSSHDQRMSLRGTPEGKPFERARIDWLEAAVGAENRPDV